MNNVAASKKWWFSMTIINNSGAYVFVACVEYVKHGGMARVDPFE